MRFQLFAEIRHADASKHDGGYYKDDRDCVEIRQDTSGWKIEYFFNWLIHSHISEQEKCK